MRKRLSKIIHLPQESQTIEVSKEPANLKQLIKDNMDKFKDSDEAFSIQKRREAAKNVVKVKPRRPTKY